MNFRQIKNRMFFIGSLVAVMFLIVTFSCHHQPGPGEKLKVAGVFTTSLDDPRAAVIYQGLRRAEREIDVVCEVTESVTSDEIARVIGDYADKGYRLVFGDARSCEDMIRETARDYPEVAFCFCSNLGSAEPNLSVFNCWVYEPAYLCGLIAGRLTETGIVGAVADEKNPCMNCLLNSFNEGVREANSAARVLIFYSQDKTTASGMIEKISQLAGAGVDYLYAGIPDCINSCRKNGVIVFGNLQDQYSISPDTVITGTVWDMWPIVEKVVTEFKEDNYQAADLRQWSMMTKGGAYLAPYHSFDTRLSFELKELIDQKRRDIMSGILRIRANEFPPAPELIY